MELNSFNIQHYRPHESYLFNLVSVITTVRSRGFLAII